MPDKSDHYRETVLQLALLLEPFQYAIRGSMSLIIQGLNLHFSDIDIVCDQSSSLKLNEVFKDYLFQPIKYISSNQFQSYFGRAMVNDILVEFMGEWQYKDEKGVWSEPYNGHDRLKLSLNKQPVFVTPIQRELESYKKMGRYQAYWQVSQLCKQQENCCPIWKGKFCR